MDAMNEPSPDTFPYSGDMLLGSELSSLDLHLTVVRHLSKKGSKSDTYLAKWRIDLGASQYVKGVFDNVADGVVIKLPKTLPDLQEISQKNRLARIAYMQTIEAHSSHKLAKLGNKVAKVLYSGLFRCTINHKVTMMPVILQEYVEGKTLHEHLTEQYPGSDKVFRGVPAPDLFATYAIAITKLVQRVHRAQVVHGDISSDNLMVRGEAVTGLGTAVSLESSLCIIDFGEAVFRDELGLGEMGTLGMLYERLERVTEAYDIRQLGLLFAFLACGDAMELANDVRHMTGSLARYDKVAMFIRERNPGLLGKAEGIAEVISACLNPIADDRPQSAAGVLSLLHIFVHTHDAPRDVPTAHAVGDVLDLLLYIEQQRLDSQREDLQAGVQHVYGSRQDVELGLCTALSRLAKGDEYMTLSHPGFWAEMNLGARGPFYTMNKVALTRGANINRVFVISQADLENIQSREILRQLLAVHRELEATCDGKRSGKYQVRAIIVSEDYRRRLIVDGNNFGLLKITSNGKPEPAFITASLQYHGERIIGVTFNRSNETGKEFERRFEYFQMRMRAMAIDALCKELENSIS